MANNLINDLSPLFPAILTVATPASGWQGDAYTWTYTSGTTFTLSDDSGSADVSDLTADYPRGLKLRWNDGADKYGHVATATFTTTTTVTIVPNLDYTLSGSAITRQAISRACFPAGWPDWFNYAPALAGFSAAPTGTVCRYRIEARTCTVLHREGTAGTSNDVLFLVSAPLVAASISGAVWGAAMFAADNNGANLTAASKAQISSGAGTFSLFTDMHNGAWASSNGKRGNFLVSYEV